MFLALRKIIHNALFTKSRDYLPSYSSTVYLSVDTYIHIRINSEITKTMNPLITFYTYFFEI